MYISELSLGRHSRDHGEILHTRRPGHNLHDCVVRFVCRCYQLSKLSTGNPLMRGTVPLMNQNCIKWQWCLWRFMCPLSMHQFIDISIMHRSVRSNFFFVQTLRCWATCESLCANWSVLCMHCRQNYSANWAWKLRMRILKIQGLSPWNTDHAHRVPTFKSMFQLKKYLVRKSNHTLILYDYSKIDIRFSEEI